MGLPPFENPNRKTRVSRGTRIWAGIKRAIRSFGFWLQRSNVIIVWAIGIYIFGLIASSYLRQIIIFLRWMIHHLVLITAIAPGVVEESMDTNKDLAVKTIKDRAGDGTVREYTAPNLEVRIGVIYALERIAQDSGQDHTHIMAVLCAYIRNNTPLGS